MCVCVFKNVKLHYMKIKCERETSFSMFHNTAQKSREYKPLLIQELKGYSKEGVQSSSVKPKLLWRTFEPTMVQIITLKYNTKE